MINVVNEQIQFRSIEACIVDVAFQVCNLKLKQGSVTIKAAVAKYRVEILQNAGINDKVGNNSELEI
jgi:hypothetical protein